MLQHVATHTTVGTTRTYTFSNVDIGAAAADRYIVVAARGWRQTNTLSITGITVAGAATSEIVSAVNAGTGAVSIRRTDAPVAAGATATIVVTFNPSFFSNACHIDVYALTKLASIAAFDTDSVANSSLAASAALAVPARGCAIAAALMTRATSGLKRGGGASRSFSNSAAAHSITATGASGAIGWSGLDQDSNENMGGGGTISNSMVLVAASFRFLGGERVFGAVMG